MKKEEWDRLPHNLKIAMKQAHKMNQELAMPNDWEEPESPPPIYSADHPVTIPPQTRNQHVYVVGSSRFGKSTLLENMIIQDIEAGHGLCVLDPKGDLVESIVHHIPEQRVNDCIYLDVANPVPIDFMAWETEEERQTLIGDIYDIFLSFATMTAGDQWLGILRWVIITLLEARKTSFMDIGRYFYDERRHEQIMLRAKNADIHAYWKNEFPKLGNPREQPILSRMATFRTARPIEILLGHPNADLNLFDVMQKRQILLVNLGSLGKTIGNVIGKLLVSKITQAAFRRRQMSERIPFYLYVDEFRNFQTSAFDTILAEAGGFQLCLTLANQGLSQLDPSIRDAIYDNVTAAWIIFHINEKDTPNFKQKAPPYDPAILANLPKYTALFKIGDQPAVVKKTRPPRPLPAHSYAGIIKKRTLDKYSCNTAQSPHTESNARKSDHIEAGGRVPPPNKGKK